MILIHFGTDMIDYPKFSDTISEIFSEISRKIGNFLGNSGNFLKVYLELFGIIGIYGRILEFKITGTILELKFPT